MTTFSRRLENAWGQNHTAHKRRFSAGDLGTFEILVDLNIFSLVSQRALKTELL